MGSRACQSLGDSLERCESSQYEPPPHDPGQTEAQEDDTTFPEVHNEGARDGWRINPFPGKVLHLQAWMVGCLEQLSDRTMNGQSEAGNGRTGRTHERQEAAVEVRTNALIRLALLTRWVLYELRTMLQNTWLGLRATSEERGEGLL